MPDFLRNDPPTNEMLGDGNKFMDYVKRKGTWEILESDFKLAKKYLQDNGAENIFLIGFCWGAKMVMAASAHDPSYKGGACVHPSLLVAEDFEKANAPMIVLPSQNERDFTEDFKLIQAKPFGKLCYMQRFDDMIHGWCAARGEWQDSAVAARANEAFTIVASGFKSILSSSCCPKSHH
ncbi:putative AIM2 family protein [Zancudomyces culisetae]|uniref:Putative AIM2 family protein n=1 Tax=Zancudomyces culisetae TaxID=1213189 RepID=A0A1R1PNA5_ZANCU|nr:putative AIM2 family protein [Zancudomyces culisetae]OMH84736.1 putative AIM2 family protein [Zancudomyces culisetae]|eukprot:OMH82382.1 putative AIM2 family protein [Zancudomyces culisetae]